MTLLRGIAVFGIKRKKNDEQTTKTADLSFHSFDGGGPKYSVIIADESLLNFEQSKHYAAASRTKTGGSPYTVNINFAGLRAGTTTVIIEQRSPVTKGRDLIYKADINDLLEVKLTKLETKDISKVKTPKS